MAKHDERVMELRERGKTYYEISQALGITEKQVNHAVYRHNRKKKGDIEYENRRHIEESDTESYIEAMKNLHEHAQNMNTRQVKADTRIHTEKPIGVAYWGDWHIGALGTDYDLFESDLHKIRDTEGLYFVGGGDYVDNYITGAPSGGNFEQIIPPGMQNLVAKHYMQQARDKAIALVKGCFLEGARVKMYDGTHKPIEEIQVGERVVSHRGAPQEVSKVWHNRYSGGVVEFETVGYPGSATATADHKVLAIKQSDIACKHRDRTCKPHSKNTVWCRPKKCTSVNFEPQWVEIGELSEGDYLLTPLVEHKTSGASEEDMYLYGLYLAEGCLLKKRGKPVGMEFNFHIDEHDYVQFVVDMFGRKKLKARVCLRAERKTASIRIYSKVIAEQYKALFGEYSYGKEIPVELMNDKNILYLAAGFLDGDGHQRKNGGRDVTITTISENLAKQLHGILIDFNIGCTLRQQNRKNRIYNDYQINIKPRETKKLRGISSKVEKHIGKRNVYYNFFYGDYYVVKVRSIKRYEYCGQTYDLEVQGDHSYVVNNVAVHNCHDDWLTKQADRDYMEELCSEDVADTINLWHGGELKIKVGDYEYLWRCRHKYKYQSSLNLENAMRRIQEVQGPCDVAAEAHLHNGYTMKRHLMGQYRIMMRTGTYKVWDSFAQKIGGHKGKPGVPVVIMFPDRREMVDVFGLDAAITILEGMRK